MIFPQTCRLHLDTTRSLEDVVNAAAVRGFPAAKDAGANHLICQVNMHDDETESEASGATNWGTLA